MNIIFDLETDGLLPDVSKIHCLAMTIEGAQASQVFANEDQYDNLEQALELMSDAESLIGHNILGYDLPVLKKLLGWVPNKETKISDTLVVSRLAYSHMMTLDVKKKHIPTKLYGSHSLKAWGYRLGMLKGEFNHEDTDWSTFTHEMAEYCARDVAITSTLFDHLCEAECSEEAVKLEHEFAYVIQRQIENGFSFDVKKGQELYVALLKQQEQLGTKLKKRFGSWYRDLGSFTPKKDNKAKGYTAGESFNKIEKIKFNPNSRDHISYKLKKDYDWKPKDFTPNGKPKIDETILRSLPYPGCDELFNHFLLSKRISQLAEGDNAWLKLEREGRIFGNVNTNGAITGRCTHSFPNLAQVPAVYSPFGKECRELFKASKDKVLVGCDADGLELRALAGYLKKYDGGKYATAAVEGNSKEGTDIHSINQKLVGLKSRDTAKTFFYAFIYGAGNEKLGQILGTNMRGGKQARMKLLNGVDGLLKLTEAVKQAYRRRGHLIGLDGRRLHVRSEHSALNTLLQSAGAILMKTSLILLDKRLQLLGLEPGEDYEFVANIHDEFQIECKELYAKKFIGPEAEQAITRAGDYYEFGCPLSGTSKIGRNWAETH